MEARDEQLRHRHRQASPLLARKLERLASIDGDHALLADGHAAPTLRRIRLAPMAVVPVALTLRAPADARPGDRYMIDIVERYRDRILGGSTFVLAVYALRQ